MKKFFFFGIILLSITSYSQEKRLALVIGNSKYEHAGELPNPVNDAESMKQALSKVGFEVLEYHNLNQTEMRRAIDDFGAKLDSYSVGLFFYAGHGIQTKGYNYLIPVDANLNAEQDVEYDCVQADRVLEKWKRPMRILTLLFLMLAEIIHLKEVGIVQHRERAWHL